MSQIEEYQSRITAAMERISAGMAALGAAEESALAAMKARLEEETQANAQLQERLAALKVRHEEELAEQKAALDNSAELERLRAIQAEQSQAMAQLDMDVQRVRQANDQLRASNAALREANEAGVGEPHLINKAMLAELESLRAARATDAAEVSTVLARLGPLLAGAENLIDGEGA